MVPGMAGATNWRAVLEAAGFGAPSFAEVALCAAVARDEVAELGAGALGGVAVPAGMLGTVRGGLLRALLLGAVPGAEVSPRGLRVTAARISGVVDLEDQGSRERPLPPLVLERCAGETTTAGFALVLRDACLRSLMLGGSRLTGLDGDRLHVQGETDLGGVTLLPGGAIGLRRADLAGALSLGDADLGWGKDAGGAWLAAPPAAGTVLNCNGARIGASVFLRQARAAGMLDFRGASIGSDLDAQGAVLRAPGGAALAADGASVTGPVFLRRLTADGEVRFLGVHIGGNLELDGADLRSPGGFALSCDHMRLAGSLFLRPDRRRSRVRGQIRLLGAEIGGDCALIGASLAGPPGQPAILAETLRIGGSLFGFPGRDAAGTGFRCVIQGGVHAHGARIGGVVNLQQALLRPYPGAPEAPVLDLTHAGIGTSLMVPGLGRESRGVVVLAHASVTLLEDQDGLAWGADVAGEPRRDAQGLLTGLKLVLDGFTYQRLEDPKGDKATRWRGREAFLRRQFEGSLPGPRDYRPQPWEQLIKVLRAQGYPQDAEDFARRKRDFAIECRAERQAARAWNTFVGVCFGHYYSWMRAAVSLTLWVVVGTLLLGLANHGDQLRRRRAEVDVAVASQQVLRPYPTYAPLGPERSRAPAGLARAPACWEELRWGSALEALGSALDMALPLVDLHQDQRCEVDDQASAWGLWAGLLLAYTLFGWVVTSLALITFSGIARKD